MILLRNKDGTVLVPSIDTVEPLKHLHQLLDIFRGGIHSFLKCLHDVLHL